MSADYEMLRRECELALDPSGPTLAYADGNQFYRDVLFLLVRVEELEAALRKHERVLAPLDAKIDFALTVGGEQQMRADLAYLRGLLAEALTHVRAALAVAGVSPLPGEAGKEQG